MTRFKAFDSFLIKLYIEIEDDEINAQVKGPLSPFLGDLEKSFENYVKNNKYVIKNEKLYLSSAFPPVPSKAFSRLVKTEIKRLLGIHYPNNLTIMVTSECGCNCNHCLAHELMGENQLKRNEIEDLIDQALELGVSQIVFEGGEPTRRKDLPELINYVDERATTMVVTNGANIEKEYIKKLEKNELDYLTFSLDSPIPKEHNEFRSKKNLFQDIMNGIKYSTQSDILTTILYIANPHNISKDKLTKLKEIGKSYDLFEIIIDEVVDSGNWQGKEVLDKKQKEKIKKYNQDLIKKENTKIINNFFSLREKENFGCFAGRRWLYSSPNGEIMPCMHTPISFGNIKKEALKSIWKKIRKNDLFQDPSQCVYEKNKYKKEILPKMIEENKYPYKIKNPK